MLIASAHHAHITAAESATIVAVIGLIGIITTAVLGTLFGRWAEATNRRRDGYSSAVRTLVAWAEYPYRIRRRTTDDPVELAKLANLGHDLQEELRCHQTWIMTESRRVAEAYSEALKAISARTGPAARDAWVSLPVTEPASMNLDGWGPGDSIEDIERLQSAVAQRFGWRRVVIRSRQMAVTRTRERGRRHAPASAELARK